MADRGGGGRNGRDRDGRDGKERDGKRRGKRDAKDDDTDSDDDAEAGGKKRDEKADAKTPYRSNMSVLNDQEMADAKVRADAAGPQAARFDDDDDDPKGWDVNQILEKQRERKKRDDENKRELQRRFEKKQYPFYGQENSPEKALGKWSFFKVAVYGVLFGSGIIIYTKSPDSYGMGKCAATSDPDFCLLADDCYETGSEIVGATNPSGRTCCQGSSGYGCLKRYNHSDSLAITPNSITCDLKTSAQWDYFCRDTSVCSSHALQAGIAPVIAVAIIFLVAALYEVVVGLTAFEYARLHTSEFYELNRLQNCMACWYKNHAWMSQLLLVAMLCSVAALASAYSNSSQTLCAHAVDQDTGTTITYVRNLNWFLIVCVLGVILLTIIGTYLRNTLMVRGEIAIVHDVDSLNVPGNLDCATCRALDRPRLCHDEVRGCTNPPDDEDSCYHKLPCPMLLGCCCGLACDGIFCCFCFPCGWCMEHCCRNIATIAP